MNAFVCISNDKESALHKQTLSHMSYFSICYEPRVDILNRTACFENRVETPDQNGNAELNPSHV